MQFTTSVPDVDIYGHEGDISASSATVEWNFEMEAREWGVKGITVFATSVKCYATKYNEGQDEETELLIDSSKGWEVETEDRTLRALNSSILPENVSIDFKEKTITVTF